MTCAASNRCLAGLLPALRMFISGMHLHWIFLMKGISVCLQFFFTSTVFFLIDGHLAAMDRVGPGRTRDGTQMIGAGLVRLRVWIIQWFGYF